MTDPEPPGQDPPLPPEGAPPEPVESMPPPPLPPLTPPPTTQGPAESAVSPATPPPPPQGFPPNAPLPPSGVPVVGEEPGWDGFAIAGFIVSLIGGVCIGTILSIVGIVRTAQGQRRGRGLAVAGVVISVVWILVVGALVAVSVSNQADRSSTGDVVSPGTQSFEQASVGDCLPTAGTATTIMNVDVTPCSEPHQAQIFAIYDLPEGSYPGEDAILETASTGCSERVNAELANSEIVNSLDIYVIYPKSVNWLAGDREVICIAQKTGKPLTGSLPGL